MGSEVMRKERTYLDVCCPQASRNKRHTKGSRCVNFQEGSNRVLAT